MNQLIIFVIGVIAGGGLVWLFTRKNKVRKRVGLQTRRKQQRKEAIFKELQVKSRITNDEVQALLGVSDATATNYLEELEQEGKIVQHGKTGKSVYYTPLEPNG